MFTVFLEEERESEGRREEGNEKGKEKRKELALKTKSLSSSPALVAVLLNAHAMQTRLDGLVFF